jgi:hypothetical protein
MWQRSFKPAVCALGLTLPMRLTPKVRRHAALIWSVCSGCDAVQTSRLSSQRYRRPHRASQASSLVILRHHVIPDAVALIHALKEKICHKL